MHSTRTAHEQSQCGIYYEQGLEYGLAVVGTPEEVIEQITAVDQQIGGLNEFVIRSNLGGIEHWRAIRTQEEFATQVIPAFAPALS